MGIFNRILMNDETIFKHKEVLDIDYIPKMIPFRENEQTEIAYAVKPILSNSNGSNVILFGEPGIGKTLVVRKTLEELEDYDINQFYVNCWKNNSSFKIYERIARGLGLLITNKDSGEAFEKILEKLNKHPTLLVFDEIDKLTEFDFLYNFLENLSKRTIILIANERDWYSKMDPRIKSRLMASSLDFEPYNLDETHRILKSRAKSAFIDGVLSEELLAKISKFTWENKDIRVGLTLLRESGNKCESEASRVITEKHVQKAISSLESKNQKNIELSDDLKSILDLIKNNDESKIGDIFEKFNHNQEKEMSYKTFQRRIKKLSDLKMIKVNVINGGQKGKTSILKFNAMKK